MSEKKKMGRPPVEMPRKYRVEIKFNEDELQILNNLCKKYNQDRSSIIRMALKKLK